MKSIFVIFLFVYTLQCFAQQNIEFLLKTKSDELNKNQIENFFFFEIRCSGFEKAETNKSNCSLEDLDIFLFWEKKEKYFFSKINLCENQPHEISNQVFNFYSLNYSQINAEKVKPYYVDENTFLLPEHTCIKKFKFKNNDEKEFDDFDLTSDNENPNLNAEENQKLKVVQLAKLCENTIFSGNK